MNNFIAKSQESKKILNIARVSSSLPVNIMIIGDEGVGKELLAYEIIPDGEKFDGRFLEQLITKEKIDLKQYKELIVTNIDYVLNKKEFIQNLDGIKIVATSSTLLSDLDISFAIKIEISPLVNRPEDLEELKNIYFKEAQELYGDNVALDSIELDLSQNAISVKRSIFKNSLLQSLDDNDIKDTIEHYIMGQLNQDKTYKDLLEIFEIPLLRAAKKKFKSQLQMALNLKINRITLRKKLDQYNEVQ